jgi:hypothetical protein
MNFCRVSKPIARWFSNRSAPMQNIIAICGAKRTGKDTIADHLVTKHGYTKVKLADPLKVLVGYLFSFAPNQVGESDDKDVIDPRWNITPRQALQFFGTEVMQYKIQELLPHIGRKFWINMLISKLDPNKKYVISDMRFVHEYEELKKLNAFIIKIERPSKSDTTDTHCSEEDYKNIPHDVHIQNDSNIENLLIKLDNTMASK